MRFARISVFALAAAVALLVVGQVQAQQLAGVHVDADGVLRLQVHDDPTGELNRRRINQAVAALNPDVARKSPLRKISLTRLEREVAARLAAGQRLTDEMRYLAGLTRLQYVFYYPETQDVVIAGPAEGWAADLSGRVVSASSGRPVLELEDLIVALRCYPPQGEKAKVIGCSIDPTQEGLQRMQEFLAQAYANATPNDEQAIVDGLRSSLGMQKVSVFGVPANTHFGTVLVEADYRMKLIGIGLERPPVKLASYVDKAQPRQMARNALARWYFVPDYQCVRVSDDRLAMEMVGDGVKLIGESEMVASNGGRQVSGHVDKASEQFTSGFTKKYAELAEKSPIFAQLRDLIDMSVAAAFIQQQDYYGRAGWQLEVFGSEQKFPVQTHPAPTQVETVVTSVWKGNQLMTPVGGGVNVRADRALESANLLSDDAGRVRQTREQVKLDLAAGQWWWD
jgi:hypothetical protein